MENKLISMTDFVLRQNKINGEDHYGYEETAVECINYAKFLKQPLTLGMFVTCDNAGNPYDLEEVFAWKIHKDYSRFHKEELAFFEDAKEKVLFKGFEIFHNGITLIKIHNDSKDGFPEFSFNKETKKCNQHKTVEELCSKNIRLTESALKQIASL